MTTPSRHLQGQSPTTPSERPSDDRRYWSPLGDSREKAIPCRTFRCMNATYALDGYCDPCHDDRSVIDLRGVRS